MGSGRHISRQRMLSHVVSVAQREESIINVSSAITITIKELDGPHP